MKNSADSKTAHTPGPWTLTHVSGSNFAVQEFMVRGMFAGEPNVYPIFNRDASAVNGSSVFVSPENAALIAAAPNLLATLEELVACRLVADIYNGSALDKQEILRRFDEAEKVIAKVLLPPSATPGLEAAHNKGETDA